MATKWTGPNGNTVSVSPFMDKGFKILSFWCQEVLGGKIAMGNIEMAYSPDNEEALEAITSQEDIEIELGTETLGTIFKIKGIIIDREFSSNGGFSAEFHCMPDKDFYTRTSSLTYPDIDSAISSLWKGEKEIRTSSDISGGVTLNQAGEFDHKFLGSLCTGYKKGSIFSYSLTGLIIKDLVGIGSNGEKEPETGKDPGGWELVAGANIIQNEAENYKMTYDYKLYKKPELVGEEISKSMSVQIFDNRYRITHKDHQILRENLYNNQKFYNSCLYTQLYLTWTSNLYPWRVGDIAKFKKSNDVVKDTPWNIFVISEITYSYTLEGSEGSFQADYILHGIEENGEIMNGEDPKET